MKTIDSVAARFGLIEDGEVLTADVFEGWLNCKLSNAGMVKTNFKRIRRRSWLEGLSKRAANGLDFAGFTCKDEVKVYIQHQKLTLLTNIGKGADWEIRRWLDR